MYKIRKCEKYTVERRSDTVELDPEQFRNLSIPYKGNSEMEFFDYICELDIDYIYDEINEDLREKLNTFLNSDEWPEYNNDRGDRLWFEMCDDKEEVKRTNCGLFGFGLSDE
jgi:hypothetical protein